MPPRARRDITSSRLHEGLVVTVAGHRARDLSFFQPPSMLLLAPLLLQPKKREGSSDAVVQEPFATAPTSPAALAAGDVSNPALTPAALSMSFYDVNAGEQPIREDEAPEEVVEAAVANGAPTTVEKHNKLYSPAETSAGSGTPPHPTTDAVAETAGVAPDDVDAAKIDGCTTPPPPPVHDSEGSDTQSADDHGSPQREKPRTTSTAGVVAKRDVAPSWSSRLLAFRSFSRDKKAKATVDARPRAHGKARDEGDEHKEKGKERRKRFWK
uniref:Uncharacterized protein n=1 Tax=Oryza meridionalis TaxID=40149 RepID=A0A0E0DZ14_9ORYZ